MIIFNSQQISNTVSRKTSKILDFSWLYPGIGLWYAYGTKHKCGDSIMDLLLAIKSEVIAEALCPSLSQYNIHICHTGPEALALLDTLRPDAVILDLCLPVMDGLSVLRQAHYKPPVILALTNLLTADVLRDAMETGVQDVILKPCTMGHIVEHLEQLIKRVPSLDV